MLGHLGGLFVALALVGCGGGQQRAATDASKGLGRALLEKDAEKVLAKLDTAARLREGKTDIAERLGRYAGENDVLARELETGAYEVRIEVRYSLSAERSLALVSSGEGYSVELGDGFGGASPDPGTLLAKLREALERLSEADLVELLVPEKRAAFSRLLESVRGELTRLEDVNFIERGPIVIARFPSGVSIKLRRVGESYFIEELE